MTLLTGNSENSISLEGIQVFLFEPMRDIRREFKASLMSQGVGLVADFDTLPSLLEVLSDVTPDILVADADTAPGELSQFVRLARHCQSQIDPFFPVIFMSWQTDVQVIRKMALSGADDIIAKPASTGLVFERIRHLVERRKRFAVTGDYVGPDRRSEERSRDDNALVIVPNRLALKAGGVFNESEYLGNVEAARASINNKRIERCGERMHLLSQMVQPIIETGLLHENQVALSQLKEMVRLSERLIDQVENTKYQHTIELGSQLFEVTDRLFAQRQNMAQKDIQLLVPMAQAVHRAVKPNLDEDDLALNIAERVANYKKARSS